MPGLFRVKAIYEYSSPHEEDLTFAEAQVITVTDEDEEDWYTGEYVDDNGAKREGIFPRNYVEKIEPIAPPRPNRNRPKKTEPEPTVAPAEPEPTPTATEEPAPEPEPVPEPEPEQAEPEVEECVASPPPPQPAPVPVPAPTAVEKAPAPAPAAPAPIAKASEPQEAKPKPSSPPAVSEKPSGNSFKDRIAAFNKPAAPPIAPFKPGGLNAGGGGASFIKKPFVAPPPSRNAYVPPPTQPPVTKSYRRDEDPEIKNKEQEDLEQAEKAGLVPTSEPTEGGDEEDQPKPTTLKERIALLQKQQREQAMRHADAGAKKEKPKKPAKKPAEPVAAPVPVPTEEYNDQEAAAEDQETAAPAVPPIPVRRSTEESLSRTSIDEGTGVPRPPVPHRRKSSRGQTLESVHDGNEADMSGAGDTTEGQDDTTEREDDDEQPAARQVPNIPLPIPGQAPPPVAARQPEPEEAEAGADEDDKDEEDEEEEDDPEARRKEELRARMAKMSGGMGFHGMFGVPVPGGPPPKKKATPKTESAPVQEEAEPQEAPRAIPGMMALPGMGGPRKSEDNSRKSIDSTASQNEPTSPTSRAPPPPIPSRTATHEEPAEDDQEEEEDDETTPALTPAASAPTAPPVPVPASRPAPPPVPSGSRPPPPAPPANIQSPTDGSASDYDSTDNTKGSTTDLPSEAPPPPRLPPMPPISTQSIETPIRSPPMSPVAAPTESPLSPSSKRNSRPPPPIPGSAPAPPPASTRPPPPPPPGGLSRRSTADESAPAVSSRPAQAGEENDSEAAEYEGDYDTDIASHVHHKDALKSHNRESSLDDTSPQSPADAPPVAPPPIPLAAAPRAVPPPVPSQPPPESKRRSVDFPRAAPPPPPPVSNPASPAAAQEDYDPYNYGSYTHKTARIDEEDAQAESPVSPQERRAVPAAPSSRGRPSLDITGRVSMSNARRSTDMARPGVDSSFIAEDIDLGVQSGWWKQANQVPPTLQGRRDVYYECDETTTTNQGSKTEITREIWVLFQDYSQTIITVRYDPYDASDAELEQRHEPPPRTLRQDQMEDFYERFGRPISEAATGKKDTVVGDGTPMGLVLELLRPFKDALKPVGTRAFGALVYSNMGNASTQQHDVIRAGDIISIRNARFQGKHGPMHAKYSAEVGKPDHVAVVAEWDGTKKKVRAWEQGRESKKVKQESFKLDDLRSGEVKIWRVMPRSWVGWNSLA